MRLVTKTIWRAFPELDRFDDAQCRRFIAVALRGRGLRAATYGFVAAAWCLGVGFLPGLAAAESAAARAGWVDRLRVAPFLNKPSWMGEIPYIALALVLTLSLGMVFALLTRDVLLRLYVRRVLRMRGRCGGCRYFLGGLPVDGDLRVVCPECGCVTEVDQSLGELARGEDGRERFAPSAATIAEADRLSLWNAVTRWAKKGAVCLLVLAVGLGLVAGWNEWRVRAQAAQAAALKPGAPALDVLLAVERAGGGGGVSGGRGPDALGLVTAVGGKIERARIALATSLPSGQTMVTPYAQWVAPRSPPQWSNASEQAWAPELSLRLLRAIAQAGAFDDAAALADSGADLPGIGLPAGAPIGASVPWTGVSWFVEEAGWECARMRVAVQENDPRTFARALDTALGMAGIIERQPLTVAVWGALKVESLAMTEARAAVLAHPEPAWLDAISAVLVKRSQHPPASLPFKVAKLLWRDGVCGLFSDPAFTRFGLYGTKARQLISISGVSPGARVRLGTLDENLAAIDRYYDALIAESVKPCWQRAAVAPVPCDLAMVSIYTQDAGLLLRTMDTARLDREGLDVLIAVERFRLSDGRYPNTLTELVPAFLKAVPIDPFSGRPYVYRRSDAAGGAGKSGYVLYSVGHDGVDNVGQGPGFTQSMSFVAPMGTDIPLNVADR